MILMSGSSACTFALNSPSHIRAVCYDFACQLGFSPLINASVEEENKAMVDFLRQLPSHALELSLTGKRGFRVNQHGQMDLTPTIDGDFLPRPLSQLRLEAPKKRVIVGITEY